MSLVGLKVKDLPSDSKLEGLKLKTPKGVVGYYHSKAGDVVLLSNVQSSLNEDGRLYPQVLSNPDSIKNWEVILTDNVAINCDKLLGIKYTLL